MCSYGSYIYMFGGRTLTLQQNQGVSPFSDQLWRFNPATNEWVNLNQYFSREGLPPGAWGHILVAYKDYLVLFGGSQIGETHRDLWIINIRQIEEQINAIDLELDSIIQQNPNLPKIRECFSKIISTKNIQTRSL